MLLTHYDSLWSVKTPSTADILTCQSRKSTDVTNNMMAVFHLAEPVQGFGIGHAGSLEKLPGTLNGAELLLKLM